jgi:WS/DGAT/MGAT family acyltransferase
MLNVGITDQRAYAARTLPLPAVKQISKQTGTTVNDVVLAICSSALRGYLSDKRALPRRSLTAMVPIASRDPADRDSANHNSLMLCSLASDVVDPLDRLAAIHRSCVEQKQNAELWKELPVPEISFPGMGAMLRRFIRWYGHSWLVGRPPMLGNLVISNIPGPAIPLYIAGARIESMYPCSVPFHGQAVNITVESYCDRLDVGVVADRRTAPDVAQIADRMVAALTELQQAIARRDSTGHTPGPSRAPEAPAPPPRTTNGKHQPAVWTT